MTKACGGTREGCHKPLIAMHADCTDEVLGEGVCSGALRRTCSCFGLAPRLPKVRLNVQSSPYSAHFWQAPALEATLDGRHRTLLRLHASQARGLRRTLDAEGEVGGIENTTIERRNPVYACYRR